MRKKSRQKVSINTSSTADIAFLLLIFFLVATTIVQHKGLSLQLPPEKEKEQQVKIKNRNLFKILINSKDDILVQGEVRSHLGGLREEIQEFVLNEKGIETLSESPLKAVVSLKANRGTHYGKFIEVLDELKGAYYEIYADRSQLTVKEYLSLDLKDDYQADIYNRARTGIPMNISIADPN